MPFWAKKIDWEKSPAHQELLGMFLKQYRLKDLYQNKGWFSEWHRVLGESPKAAIDRYITNGYLVLAPLTNILDCSFKLNELKELAKKYGIPVSGKKADLISRLVSHDEKGLIQKVSRITDVYSCSELGRQITEKYKQFRKEEYSQCEMDMLEAFRNKRLSEAVNLFAAYQKNQVFPTGDFTKGTIANLEYSLKFVFSAHPGILTDIDDQTLDSFRVAAGMNQLWMSGISPKWLPDNFIWNHRLDIDTACDMLGFYAIHQKQLNDFRHMDRRYIKGVQISSADDSCNQCKKFKKKVFDLDHPPELPNPNCTNKMGCRCNMWLVWKV
jgi:hypothetical protein